MMKGKDLELLCVWYTGSTNADNGSHEKPTSCGACNGYNVACSNYIPKQDLYKGHERKENEENGN